VPFNNFRDLAPFHQLLCYFAAYRGWLIMGDTALAEYYLQHRKSEDLDFFTQVESLYDIAVDKAQTISVRPRSRDLSRKSQEKFEIVVDPLQLGE